MKRILPLLLALCLAGTVFAGAAAPSPLTLLLERLSAQAVAYQSADWAKGELAQAEDAALIPPAMASQDLTKPVSRQDYAASAVLLYDQLTAGEPTPAYDSPAVHPFQDTTDPAVERACALGLVEGVGNRRFAPEENLTREQAATILARLCRAAELRFETDGAGFAAITDAGTISAWAREGAALMVDLGVIYGVGGGRFAPRNTLTGQECLLMNKRLAEVAETQGVRPAPLSDTDPFNGDFFAAAEDGEPNRSLSPVSLRYALGLLQPGTEGESRKELDRLLEGVDFAAWNRALATQGEGPRVEVANSIWFDTAVTPEPDYLRAVSDAFQAQSQVLDLDTRAAMELINGWVKEKTHELIPTILGQPLSQDAAAVLLNALYFKGDWRIPFDAEATYDQDFQNAGGGTSTVPFLHDTRRGMTFFRNEACTGVTLPYKGTGDWQMLFLLPGEGRDPKDLAGQDFAALLEGAEDAYVRLALPRFTLEGSYDLTQALQSLGLSRVFGPSGDLSPMGQCSRGPLFVSQVIQKTYLRVDEKGTEAAAVTGIMVEATSAFDPQEPIPMTFDRPFLCCLWNGEIGQPLFLSVVEELS